MQEVRGSLHSKKKKLSEKRLASKASMKIHLRPPSREGRMTEGEPKKQKKKKNKHLYSRPQSHRTPTACTTNPPLAPLHPQSESIAAKLYSCCAPWQSLARPDEVVGVRIQDRCHEWRRRWSRWLGTLIVGILAIPLWFVKRMLPLLAYLCVFTAGD